MKKFADVNLSLSSAVGWASNVGVMLDSIITGMDIFILAGTNLTNRDAFTVTTLVKQGSNGVAYAIFWTEDALRNKVVSHLYASNAVVIVVVTGEASFQRISCAYSKNGDNY